MSLFCLLWIPLFYFFWRSISPGKEGGLWALPLGCATAVFQFFYGPLVAPGGFGFSRWMSGFVDIVCLPVLVPLVVYLLLVALRAFSAAVDFTGFALLWLIPLSLFRSIDWNPARSPLMLVLVPVLWTALAVGIAFFNRCVSRRSRWYVIIPFALGIAALPFLAATSWWAFFSHQTVMGFLLFFASIIPMTISVILKFISR